MTADWFSSSPTPRFLPAAKVRKGSGVALVEETIVHVDSFLLQFLLDLVELLTEASVDDGLTTWRQRPVHWTITQHPNPQKGLLLGSFGFNIRTRGSLRASRLPFRIYGCRSSSGRKGTYDTIFNNLFSWEWTWRWLNEWAGMMPRFSWLKMKSRTLNCHRSRE